MNPKSVSMQNFVKTKWPLLPLQSKVSTWNFFQGPMDIKRYWILMDLNNKCVKDSNTLRR